MTDLLSTKASAIQEVVARLIVDLGPDRVAVEDDGADRESVRVTSRSDPSRIVFISTMGMEQGHYAVAYDQLRTKRNGDSSIEQKTSSGILYEGVRWVTRKVIDHGFVTGEFDTLPAKRRIRR